MSLPINENSHTVSVDRFLEGGHIKYVIVGEAFVFTHDYLSIFHCCAHLTHVNLLLRQLGTDPKKYDKMTLC